MTPAQRIVDAIMWDLKDRSVFGKLLENISPEIQQDIYDSWIEIVNQYILVEYKFREGRDD